MDSSDKKVSRIHPWMLCLLFALGIGISILGIVTAKHSNSEIGMMIALFAGVLFFLGIIAIIYHKTASFDEKRRIRYLEIEKQEALKVDMHQPYIARYPKSRFWLFILFASGSGLLAAMIFRTNADNPKTWLIVALSILSFYLSLYTHTIRIQFTDERIIRVRLFSKMLSQPYSKIVEIRAGIGSWIIKFANGQSLKIDYEMGNKQVIVNYLEKYALKAMTRNRL
jgi:hypothetical protein